MATLTRTLIADRFLQLPDGRTIDLALAEEVWIRVEHDVPASGDWAERCAALYACRHPQLVELVDYGAVGRASRFEAFRTRGPARRWPTGDAAATRALHSGATFLVDQGLSPGKLDCSRMIAVTGEPRLLPDETTGSRLGTDAIPAAFDRLTRRPAPACDAGIVLQPRSAVALITDFLEEPRPSSTRWVQLCAPAGAGASTTLGLVAREARLRGFVPLNASLIEPVGTHEWAGPHDEWPPSELAGRHVVLLSDRDDELLRPEDEREAQLACSVLGLRAALPGIHIAIVSVSDRDSASPWVALDPLRPDQLISMVSGGSLRRRGGSVMRAAHASQGWPGRFVRSAGFSQELHGDNPHVRERAATFTTTSKGDVVGAASGRGADLDGWRRLVEGQHLFGRGRHAAAVRSFREALGMFERRNDHLHAGTAWHELGQLFLTRGSIDEASRAFEHAGRRYRQAGATRRAVAAAIGEGSARTEAGQLRVAETILQTAELAATQIRASEERVMVRAALVRCLYWQGRWDDAGRLVELEHARQSLSSDEAPREPQGSSQVSDSAEESASWAPGAGIHKVQWHCAAAVLALQRRAFDEAASRVTAAIAASADGPPLSKCAAHTVAVSLHGWIGDAEAVRLHARHALDAARMGHAPIDALRLRVTLTEAFAQSGAETEARALAARLLRLQQRRIPPLLNAEIGMSVARTLTGCPIARGRGERAEAFARATGATALFRAGPPNHLPKPLSDIVDVLRSTHDYEDEEALLAQVARLLRERLGALTVAFVSAEDPATPVVSAGSGRGVGAVRAVETGILLGPLRTCTGIEIASPLRCGSATIGALGCRWSAAGPPHVDHARTLIMAAATMSGPFLKAVLDRRHAAPLSAECPDLLGASRGLEDLRHAIVRAAGAPFPVLIVGESGVGKELVARAIHRQGPRRLRSFAALNCAALTEELAEAELFGHARGAFTGAIAERRGLFEEADGGTLFLDEVSELSPRVQAKLLRVLQEGEVRRVGESFARHVEVRIVAATNRDLDASGERPFRRDLRYRLDVIRIEVPPLRQRLEDIPLLATSFWARTAPLTNCRARLSPSTLAALARYDWPGNVRELQNVISALVVAAPRYGMVGPSALPASFAQAAVASGAATLEEARLAFERRFVAAAVARAGGRRGQAARELGITRQGLAKLIKRLGIVEKKSEESSQ